MNETWVRFGLIAAVVACGGIAATADTEKVGTYTYTYRITGDMAEIVKYDEYGFSTTAISPLPTGEITIPSTLGGKKVTIVGPGAFYDCDALTGVTIPEGVVQIGEAAFWSCGGLGMASVTLPGSLQYIGESAFSGCSALTELTVPAGAKGIGYYAFQDCTSLKKVTYLGNRPTINTGIYNGTPSDLVSEVSPDATGWDEDLEAGTLNGRAIYAVGTAWYGIYAFSYRFRCGGVEIYKAASEGAHGTTAISPKPTGAVEIPTMIHGNFVTRIGDYAFWMCDSMTGVTVPATVGSIEDGVFSGCSSLEKATYLGNCPTAGADIYVGTSLDFVSVVPAGAIGWDEALKAGVWQGRAIRTGAPAAKYTLTRNPNGGTQNGKTTAAVFTDGLAIGSTAYWDIGVPARSGYAFAGWFTAADGGEKVYDSAGKCVAGAYWGTDSRYRHAGDLTVYAQWVAAGTKFTLTRNPNGGTQNGKTTAAVFTDGLAIGSTAYWDIGVPTRSGYTFDGWFTAASGGEVAAVVDLEAPHVEVLVVAEVIPGAVHRDHGIVGVLPEIPAGAERHPRQRHAVDTGQRLGGAAVFRRLVRVVGQQEKQLEFGRPRRRFAVGLRLHLRVRIQRVGEHRHRLLERLVLAVPDPAAVALRQQPPVRGAQIEPVIRQPRGLRRQQLHAEGAPELQRRVEVPAEPVLAVEGPLIVPPAGVDELLERPHVFQHLIADVAERRRVFVVQRDRHRQEVAADLRLVAVAGAGGLLEGRPADLHIDGEKEHPVVEGPPVVGREQRIAPVVDQRRAVDRLADLAAAALAVAERHVLQIGAHQRHRVGADIPVAGHQVIEGFGGRGVHRLFVRQEFGIRLALERVGLPGDIGDMFPYGAVFADLQIRPDLRQTRRIDHHPRMPRRGPQRRPVTLRLRRDRIGLFRTEDQFRHRRLRLVVSNGELARLAGAEHHPVQRHQGLRLVVLQQPPGLQHAALPAEFDEMPLPHRHLRLRFRLEPVAAAFRRLDGVGVAPRLHRHFERLCGVRARRRRAEQRQHRQQTADDAFFPHLYGSPFVSGNRIDNSNV